MGFEVPANRRYLESHEWITVEGSPARVGITDFAQDELGDVVYVELPEVGNSFDAEEQFGTIESIKAVSDLYAPVSGTVVDVNQRLADEPELVNEDPYGSGWMMELELDDESELDDLLTDDEYRGQTE